MTIMIVEDSKPMRNLIKRSLKQAGFGDHEIWEAGDGEEALGVLREKQPDIVLSDWNMPKMNGMALLQALKSEAIEVPFGFVTSEQSTEMRDAASTAGALFLIGKPFTAENFNRELSKVLQEEDTDTTTVPLKDWLLCFAGTAKEVATNPLGFASASDIQAFVDEIPEGHIGAYLPFDGSDELFWLCMFSDKAGARSLSRALFVLGPDEEDLPDDEICDSIGEIINIMAGLVKSHMEAKEIPCKIGLPHYLDSATEVNARARRQQATIRIGPVSVHLAVVRVQ